MIKLEYVLQDSFVEQTTQGSFVPHGWDDILTLSIGRGKHPGHVHNIGGSFGL